MHNVMKTGKQRRTMVSYLTFFAGSILLCLFLLHDEKSPDKRIIGKWKEASWVYDKVNHTENGLARPQQEVAEDLRRQIARDLFIHEAETWEFLPDGMLILHKRGGKPVKLNWKLKGRGHILKLHYNNEQTEFYDLSELTADKMTLYIDVEIQAKGIVRITFEKIT
jgi:hypothetical protein